MTWSDLPFNPDRKVLRQFAGLWLAVFLLLAAHQSWNQERPALGLALAAAAIVVGLPGWFKPSLLRPVFVAWMVVVFPIGWLVSYAVLAALYFVVLTPVALFFRLRGRDLLDLKPEPGRESYWEPKQCPLDPHSYFRQY
jgi:hypothetical protein